MSKPPFDPSQPFQSADNAKPPFDPNQPFESADQSQQNQPSQLDTAMFAAGQAQQMAPWNKANQALKNFGGSIAGAGGYLGGKIASAGYPNIGNVAQGAGIGLGGTVALAPEAIAAYSSLQGLYNSPNPIAQGITKTPQEIGQQMQAGEQEAGVSGELPIRRGFQAKVSPDIHGNPPSVSELPYAPASYPKDTSSLLNFMKQRIGQFGDQLPVQELADYKRMLPEMFNKMEVVRGTPQYALASQLQNQISQLHAEAIPGRLAQNAAYTVSTKLHPDVVNWIQNFAQKYGKAALKEAVGVALGGAVASRFFK